MSNVTAELDAEFTPQPGSRMDHAQRAEQESAAGAHAPEPVREPFVVETRSDMPEEAIPRTVLLGSTNPQLPILPRDMQRRRAVVIAVDNDVILCETKELAQQVAALVAGGASAASLSIGFYLPKGVPGIVIESRDWMFAAATTTAATSRVSTMVERYAKPTGN